MLEALALLNAGLEDLLSLLPTYSQSTPQLCLDPHRGRVHMPNPDSAERTEDLAMACVPEYSATRISVSLALSSRPARVPKTKFQDFF